MQSINNMYPDEENMIVVLVTKKIEIITSIKLFSQIQSINRVSQSWEHDCSANNKKDVDWYEFPSLSHFMDELCSKENDGKKRFSCKSKTLISCIPMRKTWL